MVSYERSFVRSKAQLRSSIDTRTKKNALLLEEVRALAVGAQENVALHELECTLLQGMSDHLNKQAGLLDIRKQALISRRNYERIQEREAERIQLQSRLAEIDSVLQSEEPDSGILNRLDHIEKVLWEKGLINPPDEQED